MKPMSLTVRRILAATFGAVFFVVLVLVLIYASGYRLDEGFALERTGGIHVSVPTTGARVYLGGEEIGVSSFLEKSFFIDNLPFGAYEVSAQKEGYVLWKKNLIVERSFVTDTVVFLVPEKIVLTPLVLQGKDEVAATTTRIVSKEEYTVVQNLFVATTTESVATTTPSAPDPTELIVRDGNVYVHWNRELSRVPNAFCITPRACVVEISVELSEAKTLRAEFFRDGIVYQTENGVYFSEISVKQPQIVVPIYEVKNAEFRIYKNELYIEDKSKIFVVAL